MNRNYGSNIINRSQTARRKFQKFLSNIKAIRAEKPSQIVLPPHAKVTFESLKNIVFRSKSYKYNFTLHKI